MEDIVRSHVGIAIEIHRTIEHALTENRPLSPEALLLLVRASIVELERAMVLKEGIVH